MFKRLKIQRKKNTTSTPEQSIFRRSSFSANVPQVQSQAPDQPILGHDFSQIAIRPQAKLTISQPDEPYEQEADRVADQVMRMEVPESPGQMAIRSLQTAMQRKCAASEEDNNGVQDVANPTVTVNDVLQSSGQPLNEDTRAFMELRFGHDFSQVRIHTDAQAATSAQALNARAYTVGQNVVFGAGQSTPETTTGKHLLAHELTHVIQQSSLGNTIAPYLDRKVLLQQQATDTEDKLEAVDLDSNPLQPAKSQFQPKDETRDPVIEVEEEGITSPLDETTEINLPLSVDPVSNISAEGETDEVVAYAKSLRLQGRTNAQYHNRFATLDVVTEPATECSGCPPRQCVHVTGILESTFTVTTTVTLPRVSNYRNLTPCQQERIQDTIDTVLAPHKQQHVDAFHTYDSTVSTPFDLTLCRNRFNSRIREMHNILQQSRRASAQGQSNALDSFVFDVDLDCTESE